ncbi:hypothetical protein [Kaistella jeonii]|uniref:Uncharacterized protein n=1 Tax=Kaistella jeonii TaxID=266749 RepID=A0A0C1CW30_9FLAO|nr:hypothetical protein [Kaistella jeonii]KIA88571.1 hypothetical protein OA86_11170 [Kaistella jeonii]SFC21296.1 hypothetical protein SAMN05421876_10988 [Kaistella jeonii]VEI96951.1 Uncharacterised protein [Kaistella jeonii]
MRKPKLVRNNNLTDAVLKQKADELINLLDRDFVNFAERGYDAAAKTQFVEKRDAVDVFLSDEILEAEKMIATEKKEAARSALEKTMRTILNMAANYFGSQSAQYRAFGPSDLTRQRESDLARNYKIMVVATTRNLAEMVEEGLSQTLIDRLILQGETFDKGIDEVTEAIINRDISTEKRIEALNALYRLVAKYAGIGKDIFYDTNEAKYNDYVIYDTPSETPEEITV